MVEPKLRDDEVRLEIGEGYVQLGMSMPLPGLLSGCVRMLPMTPAYAREVAAKLVKYADIAEGLRPAEPPAPRPRPGDGVERTP